tara:strand:+ start:880 stop:1089 length:210 start_codon:yes stop_codon:yes gene_type:complete
MEDLSMASELNQYAIYDCNILRINLNEMVQRRASSQGKKLTDQEIDDIAVVLRRKINWEPIFSQIDTYL